MACRGVYFSLTSDEEQRLLACSNDEEVMGIVEAIEEKWDEDHLEEVDKAWDAIHRCLGDGTLKCKSKTSLERVVLGGKPLYSGPDYIISYLAAKEVSQLAEELKLITEAWFRERYFALGKKRFGLYFASEYGSFVSQEDYEYSWAYFEEIRAFFQKAAAENRPSLFTVDQ